MARAFLLYVFALFSFWQPLFADMSLGQRILNEHKKNLKRLDNKQTIDIDNVYLKSNKNPLKMYIISKLSYPIQVYIASPYCWNKLWGLNFTDNDCSNIQLKPFETKIIADLRTLVNDNLKGHAKILNFDEIDLKNKIEIHFSRGLFFENKKLFWGACNSDGSVSAYGLFSKTMSFPKEDFYRNISVALEESNSGFLGLKEIRCHIKQW